MKLNSNVLYGVTAGLVLSSVLLAAIPRDSDTPAPLYDASWIVVTAAMAAITRSYGLHVSNHQAGPATQFWRDLGTSMLKGWPIVAACAPTVIVLLIANQAGWLETTYAGIGLAINTVALFGWGIISARSGGYRWLFSAAIGVLHGTVGLLVVAANLFIK